MKLKIKEIKARTIIHERMINYTGEVITLYKIENKNIFFTKWMDYMELIQINFFNNLKEAELFYNVPKMEKT